MPRHALSAAAFGGALPAFDAAHSIDKGQVGLDLPVCVELSEATAQTLTTTGSEDLRTGGGLCPFDPTLRIGTGAGHTLAVAPFELRWSYAFLDERRHSSGVSLSATVEAGWRSLGLGLALSRTHTLGAVGLRPGIGLAFAHATRELYFDVPAEHQSSTAAVDALDTGSAGTDGTVLEARMGSRDLLIPVGLDVPIKLGEGAALVPFVGVTADIPFVSWTTTRSCDGCMLGLEGYELGPAVQLWAGVRIEPWLEPLRNTAPDAPPPAAGSATAPADAEDRP